MRDLGEATLTSAVLDRLAECREPRFKEVMSSLIRHLHAFVRDVELTEQEWFAAIQFLTATGQKCDDKRQEFILLSDTLGVSMLVDAINHRMPAGATESTVLGPFYVKGAQEFANGADISAGMQGDPLFVSGRVLTPDGRPIASATIDVWQTDAEGHYDVQLERDAYFLRGRLRSDADGRFRFRTIKPCSYPIPDDGPVGQMLRRMGRHPYRPAHVHFMISAPGYETVVTHVFVEGDRYLDSDAVFGVKGSLIAPFVRHPEGTAPDGTRMEREFYTLEYDFGLKPSQERAASAIEV